MNEFLEEKLINQYGEDLKEKIKLGFQKKKWMTLRINTLKISIEEVERIFTEEEISYEKVSWYKNAFVITNKEENDIQKISLYKEGKIYLQSLSSMLPVYYLNPQEKESILDMAAAPGSKTTQIAIETENKALITACEKNKIRLERLRYNLEKQGATRVALLNSDARFLDSFFSFDKILLDAPCSGSGTVISEGDKNPIFNRELLEKTISTQSALLEKAISLLKPNHEMIYSTCSILEEENEKQIEKVLKKGEVELIPLEKIEGLSLLPTKLEGTIVVAPNEYYEGFFIAKLRKKENLKK